MIKLAHLYTETGECVAVVEVPPFVQGYPPILHWEGRYYGRDGDEHSALYHEVFGHVVRAREVRHHDDRSRVS